MASLVLLAAALLLKKAHRSSASSISTSGAASDSEDHRIYYGDSKQLNIPLSTPVDGTFYNIPRVNNGMEGAYDAMETTTVHGASRELCNTTITGTGTIQGAIEDDDLSYHPRQPARRRHHFRL